MLRLVNQDEKTLGCEEIEIEKTKALSPIRVKILQLLSKEPNHPAGLARELGIELVSIYYHIKMLEKLGFIKFVDYSEVNGGVAKKFKCSSDSFAIVINNNWKQGLATTSVVPKHLQPFIHNGFFDGLLVLGSPDPHGRYRARASDLSVLELTMSLGRFASFDFPLYVLDTQLRKEDRKRNLIVAGGPKVNTLVAEMNDKLPIRFDHQNFEIISTLSKKRYSENIGVIELIENPYSKGSKILVVSGLNQNGTKAAVMAMVKKTKEFEFGNKYKTKIFAKVIEGFDEDGDGIVDAIEIRE